MKTTIIFDLDGTLLYTIEDIRDSVNQTLTKFNLPNISVEETLSFVGSGARYLIEKASKVEDEEKLDEIFNYYVGLQQNNKNEKTKLYDGLDELLIKLKKSGFKIAILSNKPDDVTKVVYNQLLSKYNFDFVMGNIIGLFKPKPDKSCVEYCLKNLNSTAEESIYVGDSDVDMKTALGSNIDEIGVLWGYRSKKALESVGAKRFAEYPKQLEKLIYELASNSN